MLDAYVHGRVGRISPEAPVPVLSKVDMVTRLGGAANVARGLTALGTQAMIVGLVGPGADGMRLIEMLRTSRIETNGIIVDPQRRTTVKTRIVANHQQIVRIDEEDAFAASPVMEDALLGSISALLPTADAVIISDYAKGVCTDRVISETIRLAREQGRPVVVDPKRSCFAIYHGATVITPNLRELGDATRMPVDSDALVVEAGSRLADLTGSAILVTRSEAGMTLLQRDGLIEHMPARAREVADVSGAGDTVVSTLTAMVADGASLVQAVAIANVAASISVSRHGTYAVGFDELEQAILSESLTLDLEAPIAGLEDLRELCKAWQHDGLRVGFTNGCFDVLHPGHVHLLSESARLCDRLVVALNSDDSVRALKGLSRPVNDELARSRVISAIRGVAAVTIFGDSTPLRVIETLRPDVLIKGGDYTLDSIVGAREVESWGGQVHIVDTVPGHSTTAIIARASQGT